RERPASTRRPSTRRPTTAGWRGRTRSSQKKAIKPPIPLAEEKTTVKRPSLLLAACSAASAYSGSATAAGNPFNLTVVRFAYGTTPAQMRSAVGSADGVVVSDLSAIDALVVIPRSDGFISRVDGNPAVTYAFKDSLLASDRGDTLAGGGEAPDADGSGAGFPDPWHNLSSFLGVTNPEGILQWDDNRMNVPSAWTRTRGDRHVVVAVV